MTCGAFASTPQKAVEFFKQYTDYANSYNDNLLNMYSQDAKIIREVIKPSGETEDVVIPSKRFFKELKIGQKTAKLKKYKNKYTYQHKAKFIYFFHIVTFLSRY